MGQKPRLKIAVGLTDNLLGRIGDIREYFTNLKELNYEPIFFVHGNYPESSDPHEIKKDIVLAAKTPFVSLTGCEFYEGVIDGIFYSNFKNMLNFPTVGFNAVANKSFPIIHESDIIDNHNNKQTLVDLFMSRLHSFGSLYNNMKEIENNSLISFDHFIFMSSLDDLDFIADSVYRQIDINSLDSDTIYARKIYCDYGCMCAEWTTFLFKNNIKGNNIHTFLKNGILSTVEFMSINHGYVQNLITCDHARRERIFPTLCAMNRIQLKGLAQ